MSIQFDIEILKLEHDMIKFRRHIHRYPELGFQEEKTAKYIEERINSFGLKSLRMAKTGLVVTISGKNPKVLGIRADIDALPVQEVEGRTYGSQHKGISHSCGHDAHTSILLGLAKYYSTFPEEQRPGTLKLFFQPAEEGPGGAKPMVEAGALVNPTPEAVIALHVDSNEEAGTANVKEGDFTASSDEIIITIEGDSGHGAYPHQAIDPIPVAADLVNILQRLITRESDPLEPLVLTIGTINGGTRHNIIASSVEMTGTIRTFNEEIRANIKKRIKEIVENHCKTHRCKSNLVFRDAYSSGYNDHSLTKSFVKIGKDLMGDNFKIRPAPQMGAEDFFEFGDGGKIPVMMYFLGCRNETKGIVGEHHSPEFDVDEDCFKYGLQLYVNFINDFFLNP
ncbi:MAG: M20 metallopeptidase family protein [Candidatus Hodarchaeales archaeon]|jgi:amidohydrolase